jgi:hypothetical protein
MKVVIISTARIERPNVGDILICNSTINAIRHLYKCKIKIQVIFRTASWETVKNIIKEANLIIFACFAIRKNNAIDRDTYSFLSNIIQSGIPYGILAAGSNLNVSNTKLNFKNELCNEDIIELKNLASNALFFTSRGALTQSLCKKIGILNTTLTGDIAFFDKRFEKRKFMPLEKINNIAISDPHYSRLYRDSILYLINSVKEIFPNASIDLLLHGRNDLTKSLATEVGIKVHSLFHNIENSLDIYDKYDLHIGYRVHGHVSALSRRIPSYLLEQDGRGCDYGLMFFRKISVSSYINLPIDNNQVDLAPIDILMSMIKSDCENQFKRFNKMEDDIKSINTNTLSILSDRLNNIRLH